jgi:acyl-CoA synthetase (AMP-forming)/AMP-acid ligase II
VGTYSGSGATSGTPCAAGEPGELVHRGALVSLGYWNAPELTAKRFRPIPGGITQGGQPELAVWSGDTVVKEQALITLESDKATMEVPAPQAGVVKDVKVKLGDKVAEGSVILTVESADAVAGAPPEAAPLLALRRREAEEAERVRLSFFLSCAGGACVGLSYLRCSCFWRCAFALAFFAGDSFFVLPSDRGRGLSQTSPPSLNWVKSVSSLRAFFFPLGILEGFISPIPRLGLIPFSHGFYP